MINKAFNYSAHFFSGLFNPFLIPTMGFVLILYNMPGNEFYSVKLINILLSIVFISTCALPLLFILLISNVSNIQRDLYRRQDRIIPYIFTSFSIFLGAQLVGKLPVPHVFRTFLLGACLILIVLFFITIKWKISGHAAGMGGLVGTLLAMTFKYGLEVNTLIVALLLISGAVGTSRIYLNKHTPSQVYAGFFLSLAGMYATIYFF